MRRPVRRHVVLYRALAVAFAMLAAALAVTVVQGLAKRDVHLGRLAFFPLFALIAVGLWQFRPWARMLAIVLMLTQAAASILAVIATLIDGDVRGVLGLIVPAINAAIVVALATVPLPSRT